MWVKEYAIVDADTNGTEGEFMFTVMDVISPDEAERNYSLEYISPGNLSTRASLVLSLIDDGGIEISGWLFPDVPEDVAQIICEEGLLIRDWKTKAEIKLKVTTKGTIDA